jgi:F-type H+-transporting ATPase subunit b
VDNTTNVAGVLMAATEMAAEPFGAGEDAIPILPYIPELIFGLIAFGILYFFVAKKIVPNLEKAYTERTAAIEGGMEAAEVARAEADAAKKKYEDQLSEARAEAARIREHAKEQGAEIIADMRRQASTEAARITETAHKQIEAERQQAMVQLRGEVGQISTDLASKIVGESLQDETRQRGIVDRFLADLDSGAIQPEKLGAGEQGR